MKNFKKVFNLILIVTFLCQNVALAALENNYALRPPMQSSPIAEELVGFLNKLGESFILSKLEEYLKVEGSGDARLINSERDNKVILEIRETGSDGIGILKNILQTEERAWMRAKAALILVKLYDEKNEEILKVLLERLILDKSAMVRSVIARGSLPEIQKKSSEIVYKEIGEKVETANLDPWPRKNCLQILDAGCEFGDASHGILDYYKKKGFVDIVVVGLDKGIVEIVEAEKNKKNQNIVFVLGDINKHEFGRADIIFSMNLVNLEREDMEEHAKSLIKNLNLDGGEIYYTPSIFSSNGIMNTWALDTSLKQYLPKETKIATVGYNPFGKREFFGSPWEEGESWVMATLHPSITIETEKHTDIKLKTLHFPDGELYLRILNPDIVHNSSLTVTSSLDSSEDLVKLVLLMDLLKRNGAREIILNLDKSYDIKNGLDSLLRFYCDSLLYNNTKSEAAPLEAVKKNKGPHLVTKVLYEHRRLAPDAKEAADYINAESERIEVIKTSDNPFSWDVNIKGNLEGESVILVHSTENAYDFTELWVILLALRQKGVNSISIINAYKGYSRQDHEFNPGEAVSAETTVKIEDALVDYNSGLTIHYATQSGMIRKPADDPRAWVNSYDLVNLNAFIQPAEALFDKIAEWSSGNIVTELQDHPLVLVGPDDGASVYVKEAVDVLKKYIKKKYGIDIPVSCGYLDKKRIGDKETEVHGRILTDDGKGNIVLLTSVSNKPISACWIMILDDETSWGATLLAATYALVRETKVYWPRVLAGVVHGKLTRGVEPFRTGYSQEEIMAAVKEGRVIEPKKEHINEEGKQMPPRFFVTTKSVALPKDISEDQAVSIGPVIAHAAKTIVGQKVPLEELMNNNKRKISNNI